MRYYLTVQPPHMTSLQMSWSETRDLEMWEAQELMTMLEEARGRDLAANKVRRH
jgi:hypothetical protein